MSVPSVVIHCDGASRGNPGPAGAGAVIRTPDGAVLAEVAEWLGVTTNNVAEYTAVIRGLEKARDLDAESVLLRSDSQLLVNQLTGRYRVKSPHLRPLVQRASALISSFPGGVRIEHVPREQNTDADRLANRGADLGARR